MIKSCASGVEEYDNTAKTSADEGCDNNGLPSETDGIQA